MPINWEWLISAVIIIAIVLAIWAKVSRQTIPELFAGIKEGLQGDTEDNMEYVNSVTE